MVEMEKKAYDAVYVAVSLLRKHITDSPRAFQTAFGLVKTEFSHAHVIDRQEALDVGLPVDSSEPELEKLDVFKLWVGEHLSDASANHIVKSYVPVRKEAKKEEIKP